MRLGFLLLLALLVSVSLIVFPDIADQALRIEAFGWIFETRQGAFIVALFVLLLLLWLLRGIVGAILAGPGVAWHSLRMGSRKRREKKLKELLLQWLDGRGQVSVRALKRCQRVLPAWAMEMLQVAATPPAELPLPAEDQDPLVTVLTARMVTNRDVEQPADLAARKVHLDAWMQLRPNAALALQRWVDLAEEEGDTEAFITRLEAEWKQGRIASESAKPRLVRACLKLARDEPEQALVILRRAYRLLPDDARVLLAYGQALLHSGNSKEARRLWSEHLERHGHIRIAAMLLPLLRDDALRFYRKLEKKSDAELNQAQQWLRAELAHMAKLDGLAYEHMQALAEAGACAAAWNSLGRWYEAAGDYQKSAASYRQALELTEAC